jgi:hypothetical protein
MVQVKRQQRLSLPEQWRGGTLSPFVGWDGEGDSSTQQNMILFGCSMEPPMTGERLKTVDMLRYMVETRNKYPDAIHIAFYFDWDVNVILSDLSPFARRNLIRYGSCYYKGFVIEHIPHKMFTVTPHFGSGKHNNRGIKGITIYDISGFFNTSYLHALDIFKIGTEDEIRAIRSGKEERGTFQWEGIGRVVDYWTQEIHLLPALADNLRDICYSTGFFIHEWYGPGAIAKFMLKQQGADKHMSKHNHGYPGKKSATTRGTISHARKVAYGGGRFSLFRAGVYYGRVYTADLNSAYVAAMRYLPSLSSGEWRRKDPGLARGSLSDFGLYRIRFDSGQGHEEWFNETPNPLFRRRKHCLDWPDRVEGWYWTPEANLVAHDPRASFLEAWEWSNPAPVFPWVESMYNYRQRLKDAGNPAERTYKWGLASMYGLCAKRVGWNQTLRFAPSSHQLEWAGFITSWCRAQMQLLATVVAEENGLVSIDTDGITSLVPFPSLDVGHSLGQWKVEEYSGIIQWQNGVYWLLGMDGNPDCKRDVDSEDTCCTRENPCWTQKSRGMPRGTVPRRVALQMIREMDDRAEFARRVLKESEHTPQQQGDVFRWIGRDCAIVMERTSFAGYRTSMHGFHEERWRTWETRPIKYQFASGNHFPMYCAKCAGFNEPMHTVKHMAIASEDYGDLSVESLEHKLPWEEDATIYDDPVVAIVHDWEDPEYQSTVIFPQRDMEGW